MVLGLVLLLSQRLSSGPTGFWDTQESLSRKALAPTRPPPPAHRSVSLPTAPGRPRLRTRSPSELECFQSNGALCFINPLFDKLHLNAVQSDSERDRLEALGNQQEDGKAEGAPRAPPPRPPRPRLAPRRSGPPVRQRSMPEKVAWINTPGVKVEERGSPSSSPIPIPSTALRPPQEDAQCHLALEDQIIEKALMRAKLLRHRPDRAPPEGGSLLTRQEVQDGEEDQQLSDVSLSTDSSDSLDFSQSSSFFSPPLHHPGPPTTPLPLSLPPASVDQDDEDEDDEERDFGVSLESDQEQDQDVTMVPPGRHRKHRPSAGALVLQKALRGHLHKMSHVFNSLLTPEKRAVRKVLELSRLKGSYFGCLVQDYLSYLSESAAQGWQGYDSGLDLLQTLRQFITQMKSYLRQSSEMEPPIETLIPEDQIGEFLPCFHGPVLREEQEGLLTEDPPVVFGRVTFRRWTDCSMTSSFSQQFSDSDDFSVLGVY